MSTTSSIILLIVAVVFIVTIFILGLFTHISPSLLLIIMYTFLFFIFFVTGIYAAAAAVDTGGKDADEANKKAHSYYSWAASLALVLTGLAIVAIIIGIVLVIIGAPEEAIASGVTAAGGEAATIGVAKLAGELALTGLISEGIAEMKSASETISSTSEGKALAERISKEKKANKSLFDMGHGFSKFLHVILYIVLGTTIILTITVGILLAIGASIQGGSNSKKGLKKGAIGASLALFTGFMYLILFLVMWIKGKNLHKRLEKDLAKQEELTRNYLQQRHAQIGQAKGQYVRELISHHLNLPK